MMQSNDAPRGQKLSDERLAEIAQDGQVKRSMGLSVDPRLSALLGHIDYQEGVIERLVEALELAEHKIDQTLQGQYPQGRALGAALGVVREALALAGKEEK